MTNVVGTLNLLQSIVDHGLEIEKLDTAGTSEEYGNPREAVAHHHDFDPEGGVIFHERSPINPKSVYATSKVAADFLTMNYHDAFGVPGVVTRMFNNYGPRQNPRFVTGTIITQALERSARRARAARAAARLLLLHRRRPRPPDGRRARHPRRRLRLRPGREHLDARLGRADPARRRGGRPLARRPRARQRRRRATARAPARCSRSRSATRSSQRETGWQPLVSWEDGVRQTIALVRRQPRQAGPGASTGARRRRPRRSNESARHRRRRLPRLASRRAARAPRATRSSSRAARTTTSRTRTTSRASSATPSPRSSSTSAALAGGIGANRANPGRFWYANLLMGAHVLEQSRLAGVAQARPAGDDLLVPEAHARAVPRGRPLERLPRGDERAVRRREEGAARRRAGVPRAVRAERDLPAAR